MQLTADQQPFQQGYLPILSLCETIVYGLAPLNVDTGAGFVTPENYTAVADLATQGPALALSSRSRLLARPGEFKIESQGWPSG